MKFLRRAFTAALALGALAWLAPAAAAANKTVAYVSPYAAYTTAYLIEWKGSSQARVVALLGASEGSVARSGSQRVVTLSTPFSQQYQDFNVYDECLGDYPTVRQDTLQVAVNSLSGNDNRGTSSLVELGTITTLNGCNAGQVQDFGSLSDPGFVTNNLSMALRPSVADLVPGVALAGPSEVTRTTPFDFIAADVLTLQAGGLGQFARSGHVVSAAIDADGWLQLGLPGGQRGYARIAVNRRSGAETWLDADWVGGKPVAVRAVQMVKPAPGAGFGNLRQASRMWQSGVGSSDVSAFYIYLYQTGAGERVLVDLATGTESRTPITSWVFDGNNIVQTRPAGSSTRVRTWVPLLNGGARTNFVMESEDLVGTDGTHTTIIPPRVNFYTDTGPAVPPTALRR